MKKVIQQNYKINKIMKLINYLLVYLNQFRKKNLPKSFMHPFFDFINLFITSYLMIV